MNICITGALGHIGSHLIRNLSVKGLKKVYLVDNLMTQRYASLFDLPDDKSFRFFELDILSHEIDRVIKDSDVVVHLAAVTNAEESFKNAELVERVNKDGLTHVVELCAKYSRPLVFFSTTSVYGSQEEIVDENCPESRLKPQSPYAESKLYGEKLIQGLAGRGKFDALILRLGTIFGYSVGMRFHTAVNKFIWQAALGSEVTVWKTALNQRRPYCGLNDCVRSINHAINERIFDNQIYNIVTLNLTVKDILDTIKAYIPDFSVKFVESKIMNQLSYNVSNQKSLERGFSYSDDLSGLIKETLGRLGNINCEVDKQNL
ncbi:MAG: SDR family oxidoreductase [Candidatus Omnitrophica bacterium]|nr:SDR family oxidoreductase [Candidatus Omnitrophota bacterium]